MDTLLVRPVPVLAQVAADRFALRRLGRIAQGAGWCSAGRCRRGAGVDAADGAAGAGDGWLSGAAIFAAVFVLGGAFQFWAQDAAEVQNSFTIKRWAIASADVGFKILRAVKCPFPA